MSGDVFARFVAAVTRRPLPAALMWAEQHGRFDVRDLDPRARLRSLGSSRARVEAP